MNALALMEVQRALYTKLSGDAVLMDMVSGIYDAVPQNTPLPYVFIGDGNQQLRAAEAALVTECQLDLYVWTESQGRKQALSILNRLHGLLHLGTLTLNGFELVHLHVVQASTALVEEGAMLNGRLRLQLAVAEV